MSPPEKREPRASPRTRLTQEGSDSDPTEASIPNSDDIAVQLRRRREAAKRLPPLESGKRDPWDLETYYDPASGE